MFEALVLLTGVFFGAVLGAKISVVEMKKSPWQKFKYIVRRFLGLDGGKFKGGTGQDCVVFCKNIKLTQSCFEGAEAGGDCLGDLKGKCPTDNDEPRV